MKENLQKPIKTAFHHLNYCTSWPDHALILFFGLTTYLVLIDYVVLSFLLLAIIWQAIKKQYNGRLSFSDRHIYRDKSQPFSGIDTGKQQLCQPQGGAGKYGGRYSLRMNGTDGRLWR